METALPNLSEIFTFEQVWFLFAETNKKFQETERLLKENSIETERLLKERALETDKKFQETDKKFKETDKKFQETDRKLKEVVQELGGIGKSNGAIAEDFFYSGLSKTMSVGGMTFNMIDRNFHRKKGSTEAEYDIVLYNDYKVLVVEVKYLVKKEHLLRFYENGLKKFRFLFAQYKDFKLYGAIAGMSFEKDCIKEAQEFGFYVLTQNNESLKLLNRPDFEPKEIK